MALITNILLTLIAFRSAVYAADDEYIVEGEIYLIGGVKCMNHFGINVGDNSGPCIKFEVRTTDTAAGVFKLWSRSTSQFVLLTNGQTLSYSMEAASHVRFSSGSQALMNARDLIDPDTAFIIILEAEDPTNPTNCLISDGNYGTCDQINDRLYVNPTNCTVTDCLECFPDPDICTSCKEGKAVRNDVCTDCGIIYGTNCVQCDNCKCTSCDGGKVLKADPTTSPVCTEVTTTMENATNQPRTIGICYMVLMILLAVFI